jgi:hypothetical protein
MATPARGLTCTFARCWIPQRSPPAHPFEGGCFAVYEQKTKVPRGNSGDYKAQWAFQYSSGSSRHVEERSASVMIQSFTPLEV